MGTSAMRGSQLCKSVLPGSSFVCNYGERCRDSHDLTAFLGAKPPDLGPACHVATVRGWCPAGVSCRFGDGHTDRSTGAQRTSAADERSDYVRELNFLPPAAARALQRGQYTFRDAPVFERAGGGRGGKRGRGGRGWVERGGAGAAEAPCVDAGGDGAACVAEGEGAVDEGRADAPTGACEESAAAGTIAATDGALAVAATPHHDRAIASAAADEEVARGAPAGVDTARQRRCERKRLDVTGKIIVAPLTTVGNLPFRRIMKRFGADITVGEMALAQNLVQGAGSEWALLRRHPCEDVFGVQLAGSQPDVMARAAEVLRNEQFAVDFVDINCGCPLDLVCNKGMGAATMAKAHRLRECVLAMDRILECPVTIKLRTGLDRDESARFAHKLISKVRLWNAARIDGEDEGDVFSRLPVAAITVHGRTRQQRYSHYADWGYIRTCAAAAQSKEVLALPSSLVDAGYSATPRTLRAWGVEEHSPTAMLLRSTCVSGAGAAAASSKEFARLRVPGVPLIGNGDVLSWQSWYAHLEEGKEERGEGEDAPASDGGGALATCMLARGALIKPWLPQEIKERRDWDISSRERLDILREYTAFGLEHWGSDQQGVNHTRRFLLEWLSFLHRYVPVGLLERAAPPPRMNDHAPTFVGRDDLETLMASSFAGDWVKITELLLGKVPAGYHFLPKHKSSGVAQADAEG